MTLCMYPICVFMILTISVLVIIIIIDEVLRTCTTRMWLHHHAVTIHVYALICEIASYLCSVCHIHSVFH